MEDEECSQLGIQERERYELGQVSGGRFLAREECVLIRPRPQLYGVVIILILSYISLL